MRFGTQCLVFTGLAFLAAAESRSVAQTVPWDVFEDSLSGSVCDVVNSANAELVVLSAAGQLVIVTGEDVTLEDSFVDLDGFVWFEGDPVGLIEFAEDDDGLRTLWWTSLTGTVVSIDGFTGEPTQTDLFPSDFADVPCDACPFWDDLTACSEPVVEPDGSPPITFNLCGIEIPLAIGTIAIGLMIMGLMPRRFA